MIPVEERAYRLLHEGVEELSVIESNGMRIDEGRLRANMEEVERRIIELDNELREDGVWKVWLKRFGDKANLGSRYQLGVVLFNDLKCPVLGVTATGRPRTNEEVLSKLEVPFVKKYLELEKWKKVLNTYLKGIQREVVDGYIHPSFNLHLVKTYRSSCEMPNFQNIPVRDEEVGRLVRGCFVPRPGHVLVEADYKALEFRVAACVSGDTEVRVRRCNGPRGDAFFVKMRELVDLLAAGEELEAFGYCMDSVRSGWFRVLDGGLTRRRARVWKVHFDRGGELVATPDHEIMMEDGSFKRIDELLGGEVVYPACVGGRVSFRVKGVDKDVGREDVYNLTVDRVHNYAVSAGVFVKNCFWRDRRMVEYASDSSKDIHRDMAAKCFLLSRDQVTKRARFCAKNLFVFPILYGSYYLNVARNLWEEVPSLELEGGKSMKAHLVGRGVKSLARYEAVIKGVEDYFGELFSTWRSRRERWWESYQKRGWFRMMTGFVCQGVMSRNELFNWPIQGPAFHCLLWSLIRLNKWLRENNMRSMIVGQIHDSIVADVHREELDLFLEKAVQVMTKELREEWDWVIVPMEVEVEIAEDNWYDKRVL